jgi:hypothetical protein
MHSAFPNHTIDPATGMLIDKETGHHIGIEQKPFDKVEFSEWPKWVVVHADHIVKKVVEGVGEHISVPAWPIFHVNRETKEVTVLVRDEDDAKKATSAAHASVEHDHAEPAESMDHSLGDPAA